MRSIRHVTLFLFNAATPGHVYLPGALESLDAAAARLGVAPESLRAQCECRCERSGAVAVAHLGAGVVGIDVHGTWRFRFPLGHRVRPAAPESYQ